MLLYVEGPAAGISFQVDGLSLKPKPEILVNSGFEVNIGASGWVCSGCTGARVSGAHAGDWAFEASGR